MPFPAHQIRAAVRAGTVTGHQAYPVTVADAAPVADRSVPPWAAA